MAHRHGYFEQRQLLLMMAASLYVVLLILSHSTLPAVHVWIIAAVFSVVMNFVYVTEAFQVRRFFQLELWVALVLIGASVLGVLLSPLFVIAAILGHGVWDIAKHKGHGVPFVSWYTLGCFTVDVIYSAALFAYWLRI